MAAVCSPWCSVRKSHPTANQASERLHGILFSRIAARLTGGFAHAVVLARAPLLPPPRHPDRPPPRRRGQGPRDPRPAPPTRRPAAPAPAATPPDLVGAAAKIWPKDGIALT